MSMSESAQKGSENQGKKDGGFMEALRIIFHALLLALVVRTLFFQPFNIPSGSMIPSLLIGDYLFVSKYTYGYSHHSVPFSPPVFSGRIWADEPKRGDVAVFKLPSDGSSDYIKRVIGVPGDTVQMVGGVLFLNDKPVKREQVDDFVAQDSFGRAQKALQYRETLPDGGPSYMTLDLDPQSFADNTKKFTVPADHYFMMGDNRDNSSDSRFSSGVGFVPFENFVGKARIIFFSIEGDARFWEFWKWPTSIRWDRLMITVE